MDCTADHDHAASLVHQTSMNQDNKAEEEHIATVCRSYRQYATFAQCYWNNQTRRYRSLPEKHQRLLPLGLIEGTREFQQRAQSFQDAAIRNQFCLDCILKHSGVPHSQAVKSETTIVQDSQIAKVSSVLKSLARDWSAEGKAERDMAMLPVLQALKKYVPCCDGPGRPSKVCVPGAGVGRLALELAAMGYEVQGNEFALHMLLASDFMLNGTVCSTKRQLSISPWLLESRNVHAPGDPCRKILIPDVDPSSMLGIGIHGDDGHQPGFSMAAGDFCSIYSDNSHVGQWNAVACCFFLDAAPNMIEYIHIMYDMLMDGGVLIGFGPLLHHWSGPAMRPDDNSFEEYQARFAFLDKRYMESVDLCWQDIREILVNMGFVLELERVGVHAMYTADQESMMNTSYRCVSFVARKPRVE